MSDNLVTAESLKAALERNKEGVKAILEDADAVCEAMGKDAEMRYEIMMTEGLVEENHPFSMTISLKINGMREDFHILLDGDGKYSCSLDSITKPHVGRFYRHGVPTDEWPPFPAASEWLDAFREGRTWRP